MAKFPGFIGPAYEARAGSADLQRLVNLFLEKNESGNDEDVWTMYSTPGTTAFCTLPTSPFRGIWYGENRLFVVSGAAFYEVFSNGTYTNRGTIANDGNPAYIFPNGNQVMVVSGGQVYIDDGTTLQQPYYTSAQGYVNVTGGVNVQCYYGDTFDATMVGNYILIAGVAYEVATLVDAYHLTLTTSAPNGSSLAYSIPNSGRVLVGGYAVVLISGDDFVPAMVGHTITISGTAYTVATWVNSREILLTTPFSGSYGPLPIFPYWASIPVTASCGAVLDGFFIVATPYSKQVNISQAWNGLRWDPAHYQIKEGYPDNILFLYADHEELYVGGAQSIEVWRNTGNGDFPFQRDASGFNHRGIGALFSYCRLGQGIALLSSDSKGGPVAIMLQGYTPARVSTHALEYRWGKYTTWTDAESWSYIEEGHEFWVIQFPTAGETWVYDAANGTWHQRAYGLSLTRWKGRNHAAAFGSHVVGDIATGALYKMSAEYPTDGGTTIRRIRRAPHIRTSTDVTGRGAHAHFKVLMEYTSGDTVTLTWSNDYGDHWYGPLNPDGFLIADGTAGRVLGYRWTRLGSFYDRVYELEVRSSDKVAIFEVDVA